MRILKLSASLAALCLVVAGCVTSTEPTVAPTTSPATTTPPTTLPPDLNTITIGTAEQLTNLDSADAYRLHDWEVLGNIGTGLMAFVAGKTEVTAGIAESYEVSEDGRTYTFRLKDGVLFGDGSELTAPRYVEHVNRMLTLDGVAGAGDALGEPFVAAVEATDDGTVRFRLREPSGYFPAIAAGSPYRPSDPNLPADEVVPLPETPVYGVGAWTVANYAPGERITLEPNPFWIGDRGEVDRIVIRYFEGESDVMEALLEGSVDIAWPIRSAAIDTDLPPNIVGSPTGAGPIRLLIVNHTLAPTDAQDVRQALAAALDRSRLVSVLGSSTQILRSPIPPGFLGAADPFAEASDLETASRLLTSAGFSAGAPLELFLDYPEDRYGATADVAVAEIVAQWEATGLVRVESRAHDWNPFVGRLLAGKSYAAALFGWTVDYFDPNPFVEAFTVFGGLGTNVTDPDTGAPTGGLPHPELIDLVGAAARETDPSTREMLYRQVQDLWATDVVTIPLWWEPAWVFYREGVTAAGDAAFADALNIGPTGFLDYSTLDAG